MNKLIRTCMSTLTKQELLSKFGSVKMIDSTTISMCLKFFEWAEFRKTKAGIKIHTSIDGATGIPEKIVFSNAVCHDSSKMDKFITDTNTIYIFDKAYIDYKKFDKYTEQGIYFISRLKDNANYSEFENLKVSRCKKGEELLKQGTEFIYDKKVKLGTKKDDKTKYNYRIIKIIDPVGKELTFVTNLMKYNSEEIAWLYKRRWDIELFFKWIKQHCKIKTLIGHSENAVKLQMITGIITYLLLKLFLEVTKGIKSLIVLKRKIKNQCLVKKLFKEATICDLFEYD